MITTPKVTIGLPIYNAAKYLRKALDSLLGQTFADFELIISDNASEDETESICCEYAGRDSRIVYHRHESNTGAICNYNYGVARARGEYFKWAAHDDLHDATYLEKCVSILDTQPDVVWCHSLTSHIDAAGQVIPAAEDINIPGDEASHSMLFTDYGLPKHTRSSGTAAKRFESVLLGTTWCADAFGLFRLDALRQTRLLLPCYGSEKVLCGELAMLGKYAEVPEVLFLERVHGDASGALKTAREQQGYVLGAQQKRVTSTRWALLHGHLTAVHRGRIGLAQKVRCYWTLVKYVFQFRKWKTIIPQMLFRIGVGAERRTKHEQRQAA